MVGSHGDRLEKAVAGLVPAPGAIPMLSTVDPSGDAPRTDARYWGRNIREPVRFWPAVDRLLAEQDGVLFVEIGPHPVLARPLGAALARRGRTGRVVASLRRGEVPAATLAGSLAELYVSAAPVRWSAVHRPGGYQVELPPLPLDGERYWLPGVARGEQGGPRGTDGLRAEVRLVDGTGRVVAQFTSGAPDAGEPAEPVPPAPGGGPGPAQQPSTVDSASGVGTEQVAAAVGRLAAEALGRPAGTRLSRVRGFYELGLDSFSMVRLVNRLEETFGVELPASTAIEYPTINQLAEHIAALAPTTLTPSDDGRTEGGLAVPAARANPSTRPDAPTGGGARTGPDVEPVAIVGMACRLPSADGTEAYWRLLTDGVDAVGPVPADRWDAQALLGVAGSAPGTGSRR